MSFFNEFPMYSPNKRAKLYQSFIFNKEDDSEVQLNNFVNYKTLKWIPEDKTEKGLYQPIMGLTLRGGKLRIRTTYLGEINNGDYIALDHPVFKGVKYFTVSEPPDIEGGHFPKYRQIYQHLLLEPSKENEINVIRSAENASN